MTTNRLLPSAFLSRLLLLLVLALAFPAAFAQADPPARVGSLSHIEGSVVLAPPGDTEWTDAVLNRPITRGDRLWTDPGARAEVHLGSAVLHVAGETFLDFTGLDEQVFQASLNEGTVNARVRELDAGENFEIDTPHLAFRALQPGDYRIDVDAARGTTRVTVRSGVAQVFGAGGQSQHLQAGQQIAFAGRDLQRVAAQSPIEDGFDRWAADRNRREDESIAARYIPREVVGYHQLDPYGTWEHDPTYGAIWFPRVTVADWAPYRYGRWEWISPWGWTWIDDAPWGFAPFHYGRWTTIGSRWCWVPGRIGRRPVYAPALVAFLGGESGRSSWNLTFGSSPGIAWYPLAPGEAWRPAYRSSPVYVRNVNRTILNPWSDAAHAHRRRHDAITALTVDDFSRGRPVRQHWRRVNPAELARAPAGATAALPGAPPRRFSDPARAVQPRAQPPAAMAFPGPVVGPQPSVAAPGVMPRVPGAGDRPGTRARENFSSQEAPRRRDDQRRATEIPRPAQERAPQFRQEDRQRDEQRAQREERRRQLQQQQEERAQRDQQMQRERAQREQRQAQRHDEEQRRAQQAQSQREQALRQQQALQERLQQQREQAMRQQQALQERQQQQELRQREQAIRHQQAVQERQQREQMRQQQAAQERPPQHRQQPQFAPPAATQPGPPQRGEGRERAAERGRQAQEGRGERRSQGDEDGRGRGQGHGRGG